MFFVISRNVWILFIVSVMARRFRGRASGTHSRIPELERPSHLRFTVGPSGDCRCGSPAVAWNVRAALLEVVFLRRERKMHGGLEEGASEPAFRNGAKAVDPTRALRRQARSSFRGVVAGLEFKLPFPSLRDYSVTNSGLKGH